MTINHHGLIICTLVSSHAAGTINKTITYQWLVISITRIKIIIFVNHLQNIKVTRNTRRTAMLHRQIAKPNVGYLIIVMIVHVHVHVQLYIAVHCTGDWGLRVRLLHTRHTCFALLTDKRISVQSTFVGINFVI